MTIKPLPDFSSESSSTEFSAPRPRLNLPPKPVLASAVPIPTETSPLPTTSPKERETSLETLEKKSCSHHRRTSLLLATLAIIAALLALGMQLWTYLKN